MEYSHSQSCTPAGSPAGVQLLLISVLFLSQPPIVYYLGIIGIELD